MQLGFLASVLDPSDFGLPAGVFDAFGKFEGSEARLPGTDIFYILHFPHYFL